MMDIVVTFGGLGACIFLVVIGRMIFKKLDWFNDLLLILMNICFAVMQYGFENAALCVFHGGFALFHVYTLYRSLKVEKQIKELEDILADLKKDQSEELKIDREKIE